MAAIVESPAVESVQSSLDTSDLLVERLIVHRVHARQPNKTILPATYGVALVTLPPSGHDALQRRIVSALGSRSHGVEMSIEGIDDGDFFQLAANAIHQNDADFIGTSKYLADRLTQAQGTTSAPAGMLAVISGRIGSPPKRFLAAIKADMQDGFGTGDDLASVDLKYLQNLLLTPTQKFYKVGLLLEVSSGLQLSQGEYDPSSYRAFLFDHLITATETGQAAAYFYQHFLGMNIQTSSKKLTKDFFEHTKNFVDTAALSPEDKMDIKEALRVELKSASAIISATEFANDHVPQSVRAAYIAYLDTKGFPKNAVMKDLQFVKAQLRRPRKLVFTQGIKLLIPAEVTDNVISIDSIEPSVTVVRIQSSYKED